MDVSRLFNLNIKIFVFPASMASSEVKAKPGSDVTTAGEETLHFDDDTSKGKDSCYSLTRSCWTGNLFNVNPHSLKKIGLSAWVKIQQTPP